MPDEIGEQFVRLGAIVCSWWSVWYSVRHGARVRCFIESADKAGQS
jgi:hypothetical protein